ncbi:MAG: HAMP domain-containing sensor histidine kinase [Cytophagales bacterium]
MQITKYIYPKNWSSIGTKKISINDNDRRDIVFSQLVIIGTVISIAHLIHDLSIQNRAAIVYDFSSIVFLIFVYFLNENGLHRTAKILNLIFINLLIFTLAAVLDERIRMVYTFFPLAVLAFLIFYKSEAKLTFSFAILPMALVLILEFTNYKPFGDIQIKSGVDQVSLLINAIGSFALLAFELFFLIHLNNQKEIELIQSEMFLRKTNEELDRFVYSASHDLRAPLSSIKGLLNLMRYEQINKTTTEYLDLAEARVDKLDHFISDIINHSKNARITTELQLIDFDSLIDNCYENLKYIEGADQVTIEKMIEVPHFRADQSRLIIIVNNLLSNALKYVKHDKEHRWIKIGNSTSGNRLSITVEDNGLGIKSEMKDKIFEMFFRGTELSTGSGLGLYIVKEAVQKMGGEITVESNEGEGTKFTFLLPLLAPDQKIIL